MLSTPTNAITGLLALKVRFLEYYGKPIDLQYILRQYGIAEEGRQGARKNYVQRFVSPQVVSKSKASYIRAVRGFAKTTGTGLIAVVLLLQSMDDKKI